MNSATLLRKNLLAALQERIIPDVREHGAQKLLLAALPFRLPPEFSMRAMPYPPLDEARAKKVYPGGRNWDDVHMHAMSLPAYFCVLEGEADFLVGVTASQLNRVPPDQRPQELRGGYVISIATSGSILIPPQVPQRTGAVPPWNREEPHRGLTRILSIRILPVGALCNFSAIRDGVHEVGYSLLVRDNFQNSIFSLLISEQSTPNPDPEVSRAQLLTAMLRIARGLETQRPFMTDGLYSRFPENEPTDLHAEPLHHPIVERAHKFIQLRLHEPLTPAVIAEHVRITPTQLNRIFQSSAGVSTMNYVSKLRIETAQLLLATSDLSVQEISRLVGFRRLQHFSATFRRLTGTTPLKFRQQQSEETR